MGALNSLWRKTIGLDDHPGDDGLYIHLVNSLFTSKSSLFSAHALGAVTALSAYAITRDMFFVYAFIFLFAAAILRTKTILGYVSINKADLTRKDYERFDRNFFLMSLPFSFVIGLVSWRLMTYPPALETHTLAAGNTVGYMMGFFARNAGRPKLAMSQVAACAGPTFIGYLLNPGQQGYLYAVLLVGIFLANIYVSISLHRNIVSAYHAMRETEFLARFDKLTGLANRFTFNKIIDKAIETEPDEPFAIIFLDLDKFKEINDTLGHTAGDAVIREMARRIGDCLGASSQIARFGGDEFLIKLDEGDHDAVALVASRLLTELSNPYMIDSSIVRATASIGVSVYPSQGKTTEALIKKADIALYEAKKDGGAGWRDFDAKIEKKISETRKIETDMRTAIDDGDLFPYFQPIYSLKTREVVSFEALVRWSHPTFGPISPDVFIPIAERAGMVDEIGALMLLQACAAAVNWPENVGVAVNVSTRQFARPAHLFAAVVKALRESGLAPHRLHLEITESLLINDPNATRRTIQQFVHLGVQFSLDDFGTGYSSLSYLKDFPFRKIKIDKAFTETLTTNNASASIIRGVSHIAADLKLDLVVEGIETAEQEQFLAAIGVEYGQGYFFSHPVPQAAVGSFFRTAPRAQGANILKFAQTAGGPRRNETNI
ncbi:EAL domain-containing protein [Rhodoblastus sp.]|jgi:diguanylate cyclase (GGDEF)-like protein|uniref:putative bifunctional diguanylate cyclase/phosphodiesterase n=1 Tax=Rhodoblastus sp. TaxID=1962975 RepID=UPI002638EF40|nr:EAL domain-containing protein [Rhodoblastus sp.]